jgi:hypothetical protein
MMAGLMVIFALGIADASPIVTLDLVEEPPLFAGGTFEIQVFADVGSLEIVAFGFDLTGAAPSLTFNGAVISPQFNATSSSFMNTDVAGISKPMGNIVTGANVLLASLFFTPSHPGIYSIGIFSDISDPNEGLFFPHPNPQVDMTTTIEVNVVVPAPPAVFLLSSGVAFLLFVRRKVGS